MALKIFNIFKANAEIERIASELEAAKAVKPDAAISAQLAEALETNKSISAEAEKVATEAKASVESAQADLATAKETIGTITGAVKAACESVKLEVSADATPADMIAALSGKVSAAISEKDAAVALSADAAKVSTEARAFLSKIPGHADFADGGAKAGATLAEIFTATQTAVTTALASQGVKIESVPAQAAAQKPVQKATRAEFEAMNYKAQSEFFKNGGKLIPNP